LPRPAAPRARATVAAAAAPAAQVGGCRAVAALAAVPGPGRGANSAHARRHRPVRPVPAAATASAAAAAIAASAAAAASHRPDVAAFVLERLAWLVVAPALAALAVVALTDLLARQAERLVRARSAFLWAATARAEAASGDSADSSAGRASPPPPPASPEAAAAAAAVSAAVPSGSDLAPLILDTVAEPVVPLDGGKQQQQQQQQAREPAHHQPHPSGIPEVLALLPLALRGPTRVVLLALVATRTLRGLLSIADEAVHTFRPSFGAHADSLVLALCAQLRPLDGALVRLYSAAAVIFLTWSAIRLKTLLVARYLRRHEAEAALALARRRRQDDQQERSGGGGGDGAAPFAGGGVGGTRRLLRATSPPPVDLVRLLLPLDEAASWFLAVAAALLVAHNQLGVNLSALVAVGGAGSLVVALGTQQLVSNAVSGLNLLLSAPFVVGESVTLVGGGAPAGGISGVVEQVSVVRSRLRTDDDVLVEVPNAALASMIVYNRSRTDARTRGPTDRLVLRVPLRVRVLLPPAPAVAAAGDAGAAAAAAPLSPPSPPAYQRCAAGLRAVLEGPLARGLVEPHSVSVDVLRLSDGGGLEIFTQAMVLRDKRAEEQGTMGGAGPAAGAGGGGGGGAWAGGRGRGAGPGAGRARVAELLSALAGVAQREGGRIVQV